MKGADFGSPNSNPNPSMKTTSNPMIPNPKVTMLSITLAKELVTTVVEHWLYHLAKLMSRPTSGTVVGAGLSGQTNRK